MNESKEVIKNSNRSNQNNLDDLFKQNKVLFQTTASEISKTSAENDFNEINNLIKLKIDADNSLISNSKPGAMLNSSILSSLDNWVGNVSREDSKVFEENFNKKSKKKKLKIETTPEINIDEINDDYTEGIDEERQVTKLSESNNKKLLELLDSKSFISCFPVKFYTSPKEEINYNINDTYDNNQKGLNFGLINNDQAPLFKEEKDFRSSFAALNNCNYTSNASTNLTSNSLNSNIITTTKTPKHQKITSDHNIVTKSSNKIITENKDFTNMYNILHSLSPTNLSNNCTNKFVNNSKILI